jgi:hypothetical protein
MQHLVKSPTCGAIDIDIIMNKRSPGNLAITMTRLKNSILPTQNSEEPRYLLHAGQGPSHGKAAFVRPVDCNLNSDRLHLRRS